MMIGGNKNQPGGVPHRESPQSLVDVSTSSPSWDDSLKPTKNAFSDIYSALRGPGKEAPSPLMNIKPPELKKTPPHLRLTCVDSGCAVKTADLLGLGDISSERSYEKALPKQGLKGNSEPLNTPGVIIGMQKSRTSISTILVPENDIFPPPSLPPSLAPKAIPSQNRRQETAQDHARRIEQEINANEKLLSDTKAIGFVPPHLRPVIPEIIYEIEDDDGNWIPPHLRRPKFTKSNTRSHTFRSVNAAWPQVHGNQGTPPTKPSKVSVVITPLTQASGKATNTASNTPTITPTKQQITLPTRKIPSRCFPQRLAETTPIPPENRRTTSSTQPREASQNISTMTNPLTQISEPIRRAPTPPPPPPSNISTAYYPLPPNSPPPYSRASSYTRDDNASYPSRQDARSYYCHSSYGGYDNGSQFLLLDHQKARTMRSYTRYRAKPGYAPHDPRLPFEYMHKLNGNSGAKFGMSPATVGRSISTAGKKHNRQYEAIGNRNFQGQRNPLRIPDDKQTRTSSSTVVLEGGFLDNGNGDYEEDMEGEVDEGEVDEYEYEDEYDDENGNGLGDKVEVDDLAPKAWPQPTNERLQRPRGIIISGLPRNQTLKQISRVCRGTGTIENIQMSKKYKMALVTFVDASIAERFYQNTDNGGITLIFQDETQAIMRQQVFVGMNPEILPIDQDIQHTIDTADGSRVLRIIGWDRDSLEESAGCEGEKEVSYDELLMRLASRYVDSQERDRKVQGISWKKNPHGFLEATFIFAGIKDAMIVRYCMEREHNLEGCHIMFGVDPCVS